MAATPIVCPRAAALVAAALAAIAAACAVGPAPARAAVIASSAAGFDGGPALASDGRIVIGERRGGGARRIIAVDPATRAVTELAAFPALGDPQTYPELTVTGTGGIVTAALSVFHTVPTPTNPEEQALPLLLETRTMTVLPTLAALGRCTPNVMLAPGLAAAGGTDFVASIGDACWPSSVPSAPSRAAVRLRTAAGTLTIPAATGPADQWFAPEITDLRATGPMVAWVETALPALGSQVQRTLVVARGATGRVLMRVPFGRFPLMLGLGADGTVVLTRTVDDFPCAANIVSPAAPSLRRITLAPPFCANWNAPVAVSGGRFVYAAGGGYGVSDLNGTVHPLAEANGANTGIGGSPVAFDGKTAFVVRTDCDADRLLAVDASAAGTAPPAQVGVTKTRCPVRRAGPARLKVAAHGIVRIALRCPKGCRGTLRLVEQRRGRRERTAASAMYASAGGDVVVRLALEKFARRLAGCSGGLRVAAVLLGAGESRRGLGDYRIVSRARCRRGGGPAFPAPLPGPRP